jgi:hypothetical protein
MVSLQKYFEALMSHQNIIMRGFKPLIEYFRERLADPDNENQILDKI